MMRIKICGITDADILQKTLGCGADFIGFVFVKTSPRYITPDDAMTLWRAVNDPHKHHIIAVGLFADTDPEMIAGIASRIPLGMIQLHGAETTDDINSLKTLTTLPIMKAIGIKPGHDPHHIQTLINIYAPLCDWLLLDHQPATGESGGTGTSFDWQLLQNITIPTPWMLAGGLTPDNVSLAIQVAQPDAVDVSSGVESTRGIKSAQKIADFIAAAKQTG